MNKVKVVFQLEEIEDGFPPVGSESLNGELLDDGFVKLDNTPFFVEEVACGDVVRCIKEPDSNYYVFQEVVKEGTSKAVSIIFLKQDSKERVYQFLKNEGCYCEYGEFALIHMLAVEVGIDADYQKVSNFLSAEEERGNISYSELCL